MTPGDPSELIVRAAAWVATGAWVASEWRRLRQGAADAQVARAWQAGAVAMLVHVALAFGLVHDWSHDSARAEVARETLDRMGAAVGEGVWVNYAFLLIWGADAAWWRLRPASYAARPRRLDAAMRAFVAFMFLNGAVVFARGPMRVAGVVAFLALGAAWWASRRRSA
jgi:hypothetical protein